MSALHLIIITVFYPFCGLAMSKVVKFTLLFAFPGGDWRERRASGKLLGGEIDGHVRVLWFAGA
jgi:hypothetical protein